MLNPTPGNFSSLALLICLSAIALSAPPARDQSPTPSPTPPRRQLPKPAGEPRGFEKYSGQDASKRLIAAGATRGVSPRHPVAPLEGYSYSTRPFFAWEIDP